MRLPRSAVLAVTAWLAVVLVGSTLVWTVISRAGQEVQGGTELRAAPTRAGSSPAAVHQISPGRTLSPKPTPSGRPGRSQPASPAASSAAPSPGPGPTSSSRGTSVHG
ncbi:MAG TPA: hypothetical protein PLP61_15815, partial [Nocardioides sp.]|nr:hypothetical protein [Nocardioides sp.]